MLPLWLLLPLVDGVSQNVSDYCKETQARRPQRANVVLALRGESFRNGAGQATIHTCCPSSFRSSLSCREGIGSRPYGRNNFTPEITPHDTPSTRPLQKETTHYYVRKFDPSRARAVSSPGVARLLSFAPSAVPRNAQPSVVSSNRTTPSQASSFAQ